jgi:hypothetical protein
VRSITLLFTPRGTAIQVLGEKLGQSDLSRNRHAGTDRRRDVTPASVPARTRHAAPVLGVQALPLLPKEPRAFPRPLEVCARHVLLPYAPPGRATLGPVVRSLPCPARAPAEAPPYRCEKSPLRHVRRL